MPLQIREYTEDRLAHVLDTISEDNSTKICEESVSSNGGIISSLLPVKHARSDVVTKHTLGYTVMGEAFSMDGGMMIPAKREDFEFGKVFCRLSTKLLARQSIKAHPHQLGVGLTGVLDGLEQLREGKVSGAKLVYRVAE